MSTLVKYVFFLSTAQEESGSILLDDFGSAPARPHEWTYPQSGAYEVRGKTLVRVAASVETQEEAEEWAEVAGRARTRWLRENPYGDPAG